MLASVTHNFDDSTSAGVPLGRSAAEVLAQTLRAVADPTRLQLLSMIADAPTGEVTVGDLAKTLGMTQPTITHHLRIMVAGGLLTRDQRGRQVWHSIVQNRKAAILDLLR